MTEPNTGSPQTAIVDIDGTLALHVLSDGTLLRPHHEYRAVAWDLPHQPVIDTVNALRAAGWQILFCSGRPVRDRHGYDIGAATYTWLARHVGQWTLSSPLFMRAATDMRPDDLVKAEIYERFIRGRYEVSLAIDDRPRVIRMWLALGLSVFDVAPGSGEF
jgi:hypothetical protein